MNINDDISNKGSNTLYFPTPSSEYFPPIEPPSLHGFVLQKDYYTSSLLTVRKGISNNSMPFINILDKIEPKYDFNTCYKIKKVTNKDITSLKHLPSFLTTKSRYLLKNLKFPLPKPGTPLFSSLDFYEHLRGDYKLCYIADDSNIPSRHMKRFVYSSKVSTVATNNNNMNKTNHEDSKFAFTRTKSIPKEMKRTSNSTTNCFKKHANISLRNKFITQKLTENLTSQNKSNKNYYEDMFKTQIKM